MINPCECDQTPLNTAASLHTQMTYSHPLGSASCARQGHGTLHRWSPHTPQAPASHTGFLALWTSLFTTLQSNILCWIPLRHPPHSTQTLIAIILLTMPQCDTLLNLTGPPTLHAEPLFCRDSLYILPTLYLPAGLTCGLLCFSVYLAVFFLTEQLGNEMSKKGRGEVILFL